MKHLLFVNGYGFHRKYDLPALFRAWGEPAALTMLCSAKYGPDATLNRAEYRDVFVLDGFDTNADVERLAWDVCRGGADAVVAANEGDMLLAAKLRDAFGLPGMGHAAATVFRDKVRMKHAAAAAGFAVPEFAVLDSPLDAYAFVERHGFPVVVKPRRKAGGTNVRMVGDAAELDAVLRAVFARVERDDGSGYEIERAVDGPQYSLNGFVLDAGEVACWPNRIDGSWLEMVRSGTAPVDAMLAADDPALARLNAYGHDLLAGLGLTRSVFHLEFFEDRATGALVLCEIAARSPGMLIADCWKRRFGLDLHEVSFLLQAGWATSRLRDAVASFGREDGAPRRVVGYVSIPTGTGVLTRPSVLPEIDGVEFKRLAVDGAEYHGAADINAVALQALIDAPDAAALAGAARTVASWHREHFRYST